MSSVCKKCKAGIFTEFSKCPYCQATFPENLEFNVLDVTLLQLLSFPDLMKARNDAWKSMTAVEHVTVLDTKVLGGKVKISVIFDGTAQAQGSVSE